MEKLATAPGTVARRVRRRLGKGLIAGFVFATTFPALAAAPSAVDPGLIDQAYAQSLVAPGQQLHIVSGSIQDAVNAASSGDVIFVPPGTYTENVQIRG